MANNDTISSAKDLPPRSRLYQLAPLGVGTPLIECLTSYINRLAWAYRVSPHLLLSQEVIPHLSKSYYFRSFLNQVSAFCHVQAMHINGTSEAAVDWAETLERLTVRSDLQNLILSRWVRGLTQYSLLRRTPAWCPECYHEWREQGQPIYQPMMWMIQTVTICLRHKKMLEECCSQCQKRQAVIPFKLRPGYCTYCAVWLGTSTSAEVLHTIDDQTLTWQEWIIRCIGELYKASVSSEPLSWERILVGLAVCAKAVGGATQLARLTNMERGLISQWLRCKQTPSFKRTLELCYVLGISPLQLMTADSAALEEAVQAYSIERVSWSRRRRNHRTDYEAALKLIQEVLDGREVPMTLSQIEHRLGIGQGTLYRRFPQECALVVAQYRIHCAKRKEQRLRQNCEEVQRATFAVYSQGEKPTKRRVEAQLSDPSILAHPEVRAKWRAVREELERDLQ